MDTGFSTKDGKFYIKRKLVKGTRCHYCNKRLATGLFCESRFREPVPVCDKCGNRTSKDYNKYGLTSRYLDIDLTKEFSHGKEIDF